MTAMSGEEFKAGLRRLGLTQPRAAKLFGASLRAVEDWCARGPNPQAALAINLLLDLSVCVRPACAVPRLLASKYLPNAAP